MLSKRSGWRERWTGAVNGSSPARAMLVVNAAHDIAAAIAHARRLVMCRTVPGGAVTAKGWRETRRPTRLFAMPAEFELKFQKLNRFLDEHGLDGVLLTLRSNFAWITCGRDNHIANNSPNGVATILATRDGKRVCLANTIEAPRMRQEELSGTGIDTIDFPWWDA